MKIAIVGAGYVGLVTGVSLAFLGHKVVCIESNIDKVSVINAGRSPFYELGLNELLKKVISQKLFSATTKFEETVLNSDITIIAVGTPTINNKIDLTAIKKASEQIGKALQKIKNYHIVAVKSTVLPGVTGDVVRPILEKYSGKKIGEFGLCMNPEFLREGRALEDALNPDRVVIGQIDQKSGDEFVKIYAKLKVPKVFTNLKTAEMIKYAANALFATLISFSNEIAKITSRVGEVDATEVWDGVHLDRRLTPLYKGERIKSGILSYILSGCGYGGSCLPKDTKALLSFAQSLKVTTPLLKSVIEINKSQPDQVLLLLKEVLGKNLSQKKIAVLGLAFKPGTDDTRESPAIPIIEGLLSNKAQVICHDPMIDQKNIPSQINKPQVTLAQSLPQALTGVDAAIVVTSWPEYVKLSPEFFKKHMQQPIVIDGRRIYDKKSFLEKGVIYKGIGA